MAERASLEAYLTRVSASLRLPPDLERDVLEELRTHVMDAVDSFVASGGDPQDAEREALVRLGQPEILGDEIRRAHQTNRRLLAAAAGGVWAAGGGAFRGFVFGMAMMATVAFTATLGVRGLQAVGLLAFDPSIALGGSAMATAALAVAFWFAAWRGSRVLVSVVSQRSRRQAGGLRPWIAIVGGSLILALVLFWFRAAQSELSVIALLIVPLVFAVGALTASGRAIEPLRRSLVAVIAVLLVLVVATLMMAGTAVQTTLSAVGSGPFGSMEELLRSENRDLPGRYVADAPDFGDVEDSVRDGVVTVRLGAPASAAASRWHDLRLEAWRSLDLPTLDRQFTSPFATGPLVQIDDRIEGSLRIDATRDVQYYWLVVTGVAADGQRDLLRELTGSSTSFAGTVWDWLTTLF